MDAGENHGKFINLDTFGIAGSHYGADVETGVLDQGLFAGSWSPEGFNADELTFSPGLGPILHGGSLPDIFLSNDLSLDSCVGWSDLSQSPFMGNGYLAESPIQENDRTASWDSASLLSESTYARQRSVSLVGAVNTTTADAWNESMMATQLLHPHSLPANLESCSHQPANKAESVSSYDSSMELCVDPTTTELLGEGSNTQALTFYDVVPGPSSGSMVSNATAGSKKPRGRRGGLTPDQRQGAAKMRKIGACQVCRSRKARCDGNAFSIYCGACIKYFKGKGTVPPQPCRGSGVAFESLAEVLMKGHVFPKNRPLNRYLGDDFQREDKIYSIYLNLGFGASFRADIKLVEPKDNDKLVHRHISYDWPPEPAKVSMKKSTLDFVFPAVLVNTEILPKVLEKHITMLLDNEAYFLQFPLYESELQVLQRIYAYYQSLPEDTLGKSVTNGRTVLRQALKLLILVHIGGDTRLDDKCQATSQSIVSRFFPEIIDSDPGTVHIQPCFIRGQLGPIFAHLAKKLMKDVLGRLEVLGLSSNNCQHFPLILSTFAVLFMTVESIQYHAAKESYHASYDSEADRCLERKLVFANEEEGVENLLQFYEASVGNCHATLHDSSVAGLQHLNAVAAAAGTGSGTATYLRMIKGSIDRSRHYLVKKQDLSNVEEGVQKGDMSVYFDRLLAKLLLTRA